MEYQEKIFVPLVNEKLSSIDTGLICFIGTDHEKVALIVASNKRSFRNL